MTSFTKLSAFIIIVSLMLVPMFNNVGAECYMNCAAKHWSCFNTCGYKQCVDCRNSQWHCFEGCVKQNKVRKRLFKYVDEGIKNSKQVGNQDTISQSTKPIIIY